MDCWCLLIIHIGNVLLGLDHGGMIPFKNGGHAVLVPYGWLEQIEMVRVVLPYNPSFTHKQSSGSSSERKMRRPETISWRWASLCLSSSLNRHFVNQKKTVSVCSWRAWLVHNSGEGSHDVLKSMTSKICALNLCDPT